MNSNKFTSSTLNPWIWNLPPRQCTKTPHWSLLGYSEVCLREKKEPSRRQGSRGGEEWREKKEDVSEAWTVVATGHEELAGEGKNEALQSVGIPTPSFWGWGNRGHGYKASKWQESGPGHLLRGQDAQTINEETEHLSSCLTLPSKEAHKREAGEKMRSWRRSHLAMTSG